jgi:hypothetical protein
MTYRNELSVPASDPYTNDQYENEASIADVLALRMAEQRAQNAARLREVLAGD